MNERVQALLVEMMERPSVALVAKARAIEADYAIDADAIPQWVLYLAGSNEEHWQEAVEWAKIEIEAAKREVLPPGAQKGQAVVEIALGLFVLTLFVVLVVVPILESPAMKQLTADVAAQLAAEASLSQNVQAVAPATVPDMEDVLPEYLVEAALTGNIDQTMSHAIAKHGAGALAVYECINKNGTAGQYYNPGMDRWANICQLDNGKYGVQIINNAGEEITAFINKSKCLKEIWHYLGNRGFIVP